jgi:hypothetical protein
MEQYERPVMAESASPPIVPHCRHWPAAAIFSMAGFGRVRSMHTNGQERSVDAAYSNSFHWQKRCSKPKNCAYFVQILSKYKGIASADPQVEPSKNGRMLTTNPRQLIQLADA